MNLNHDGIPITPIIIFAVGVNDLAHHSENKKYKIDQLTFVKNIKDLINQAKKVSQEKAIIVIYSILPINSKITENIPDSRGFLRFEKDIVLYNNLLIDLCEKEEIMYCDNTIKIDSIKDIDFEDGLHPSESGHLKLFKTTMNLITKLSIT